jgi:hypothetical protein
LDAPSGQWLVPSEPCGTEVVIVPPTTPGVLTPCHRFRNVRTTNRGLRALPAGPATASPDQVRYAVGRAGRWPTHVVPPPSSRTRAPNRIRTRRSSWPNSSSSSLSRRVAPTPRRRPIALNGTPSADHASRFRAPPARSDLSGSITRPIRGSSPHTGAVDLRQRPVPGRASRPRSVASRRAATGMPRLLSCSRFR